MHPESKHERARDGVQPIATSERWAAEASLLFGSGAEVCTGLQQSLSHYASNPQELALKAAAGVALGYGIGMMATKFGASAVRSLPAVFGVMGVADLVNRFGEPVSEVWNNPNSVDSNRALFGTSMASALVDYSFMGLTGVAGSRLALATEGLAPLVEPLASKYAPNSGLADWAVTSTALRGVRSNLTGWQAICDDSLAQFGKVDWLQAVHSKTDLGPAIDSTLETLEGGFRKVAPQRQLPEPSVYMTEPEIGTIASYSPSDGSYGMNVLTYWAQPKRLPASVAHEATHGRQYALALRHVADKLKLGPGDSPENILALKTAAKKYVPITDQCASNLLKWRNGEPCTPAETTYARKMLHAMLQEQRNPPPLLESCMEADFIRSRMLEGQAVEALASTMDDKIAGTVFGSHLTPEVAKFLEAAKQPEGWSPQMRETANLTLSYAAFAESEALAVARPLAYKAYRRDVREVDAWRTADLTVFALEMNPRVHPFRALSIAGSINAILDAPAAILGKQSDTQR